jgi:putative ABC transport system substrate-binding protein
MQRRNALVILAGAAVSWPFAGVAQPARNAKIGYVGAGSVANAGHHARAFEGGLRDLGYVVGRDVVIEYRWAEGELDRLPGLVTELIRLGIDVMVSSATPALWAAKEQTTAIPIVAAGVTYPVESGLVANLARPGGNITGLTHFSPELGAKRLELLRELVPNLLRVAVLWNPNQPGQVGAFKDMQTAAGTLMITVISVEARNRADLDEALPALLKDRPDAFLELADPLTFLNRKVITAALAKDRLPGMHSFREWPDGGGMMSYGANFLDLFRRSAGYVDKILRGAKPADLPVEQPTKFELVINLKTAQALGLIVPQSLLARADEVIE